MTWLTADDIADRLGVARRTALTLMGQMQHSVIGGTQRKRIRVSEESFDLWMAKRTENRTVTNTIATGSKRKLKRR